jgi:PKD repeat protein
MPADEDIDSISAVIEPAGNNQAWLALGNYALGRWELFGPYNGAKTIAADSSAYLSPGGNLYSAVLTADGDSVTLSAMSVRTYSASNAPPTAQISAHPQSGPAPLLVDLSAAGSFDSDGNIISFLWDFDGTGGFEEISAGENITHTFTEPGVQTVTVAAVDNRGGYGTAQQNVNVGQEENELPVAGLSSNFSGGIGPWTVTFSALPSYDNDGAIVLYEWDFNFDNVFDGYGTSPSAQHEYVSPGEYMAQLRVTDDDGGQGLASMQIVVNDEPIFFEREDVTGTHCSITMTDGGPGIAYHNSTTSTLEYRIAQNAEGSVWSGPLTVDDTAGSGLYSSLAMVHNSPAVVYSSGSALRYKRAATPGGEFWPPDFELIDAVETAEKSLVVIAGVPMVSYHESAGNDLQFARALDQDGDDWASVVEVETELAGFYNSLAEVDGRPAIAFYRNGLQRLEFVRALDSDGLLWGDAVIVDDVSKAGLGASMAIVNGQPAVAYGRDAPESTLMFVRALNADGSQWGAPVVADAAQITSTEHISLAMIQSRPAIAYLHLSLGDLRYVRANDSIGASWALPRIVDFEGSVGEWPGLISSSGKPAISYFDSSKVGLKFVLLPAP